jgi:hypothetical protein
MRCREDGLRIEILGWASVLSPERRIVPHDDVVVGEN